jgi:REP element-mobilizing transposase RayT
VATTVHPPCPRRHRAGCLALSTGESGLTAPRVCGAGNHLHYLAQSPNLAKSVAGFKSFTARNIIDHLEGLGAESTLQRLRFAKKAHKADRVYQVWQEGVHAEMVYSEDVMRQKLDYTHHNPVKRGYVDVGAHWRYSSARDYEGQTGLLEVQRWY